MKDPDADESHKRPFEEGCQYVEHHVRKFYDKTLLAAKLGGPFSIQQLECMFAEAHFAAEITWDLPPAYSPLVERLGQEFGLLQGPRMLLTCLGDNLRIDRDSMVRARELYDKKGTDLDSWLMVEQRNRTRDQFLEVVRHIKKDSEQYQCLK